MAAWIKLKPGTVCATEELLQYCRDNIAHYKVPHHMRFVDEYPMTITGKIQKYIMRERMIEELQLREDRTA